MIVSWIKNSLNGCDECWYRIGHYRIIADVQENSLTILILDIGDRKEIYKKIKDISA